MAKKSKVAVKEIPLNQIKLGRNSRMNISNEEIAGLMESIKETGLLQPIGVVPGKKGGYEICYGNRRFLAFSKLGFKTIPAILHDTAVDSEVDMKNLTENVQRRNLSLTEAGRYVQLLKAEGLTSAEIAVRLGVSVSYVNACIDAYEQVPKEFREDLTMQIGGGRLPPGKIGMQTARAILSAEKSYHLNKSQVKKLFKEAKHNEEFKQENIHRYAEALRRGKDPLKEVKPIKNLAVAVFIDLDEEERLWKKHVENGPCKNLAELCRLILSGKIHERVKVLDNKKAKTNG
jgi:ParB/RepB/Spo0J family partition protein